ncbi:MAG TPA: hypothetical protein VII99_06825 [Bacteroidia bacterium]
MKNLFIILLAISFCGCGQSGPNEKEKKVLKDTLKDTVKVVVKKFTFDHKYDDLALILAGMKPDSSRKEYADIQKKQVWTEYKTTFDSSWANLDRSRLVQMRQWASTELAEPNKLKQNIFYPFGGPDFLNVYTLFPNGKQYTLMGLEPVGDVPDIKTFKDAELKNYLASIYNSLDDLFHKSYFITRKMGKSMHSNEINGVTPLLYVFLARTGNQVVSTNVVEVNSEGNVVDYQAGSKTLAKGVKIEFLPLGQDSVRTMYYFSADVEDSKLKDNPGFVKYLDNIGTVTSYVKSASYLMHYLTFSTIRNAALKHSAYLLQDDSGIAYRFFDKGVWDIRLYGVYTQPVSDFKGQFEKDLSEAYSKNQNVKPISFTLGYHWGSRGINLLFAKKVQAEKK